MSKSKNQKKLPPDTEKLSSDEVMQAVFGKVAQRQLKREARKYDDNQPDTDAPPTTED
jgi:hypothetical protein